MLISIYEGAGGLFDFNATLPFVVGQFLFLNISLIFFYYRPVAEGISDRKVGMVVTFFEVIGGARMAERITQYCKKRVATWRLLLYGNIFIWQAIYASRLRKRLHRFYQICDRTEEEIFSQIVTRIICVEGNEYIQFYTDGLKGGVWCADLVPDARWRWIRIVFGRLINGLVCRSIFETFAWSSWRVERVLLYLVCFDLSKEHIPSMA